MEIEKFRDDLKNLGKRVTSLKDNIANEEKTIYDIKSPIDIYNFSNEIIEVTKKFL